MVFVAKHLRPLITNGNGKPLARLERSTGTSDLKLAKSRYAEIRSALEQEIQVRSGSLPAPASDATQATELRQFQLKRRLGEQFAAISQDPPQLLHSGELEARKQSFEASLRSQSFSLTELKELIDFYRAVLNTLVERFILDSGLPITTADETSQVARRCSTSFVWPSRSTRPKPNSAFCISPRLRPSNCWLTPPLPRLCASIS